MSPTSIKYNVNNPNVLHDHYHLDASISDLRVVGDFFKLFYSKFQLNITRANVVEQGHTPRLVAHDLGLHDFRMSHKRDARLVVVLDTCIW